jgi:hypothetical protein
MEKKSLDVPRDVYLAVKIRIAASVLAEVAQGMYEMREGVGLADRLNDAARTAQRVARALELDDPLLPE